MGKKKTETCIREEKLSSGNQDGEFQLMERILKFGSLYKPMVASLQTRGREYTCQYYNDQS